MPASPRGDEKTVASYWRRWSPTASDLADAIAAFPISSAVWDTEGPPPRRRQSREAQSCEQWRQPFRRHGEAAPDQGCSVTLLVL